MADTKYEYHKLSEDRLNEIAAASHIEHRDSTGPSLHKDLQAASADSKGYPAAAKILRTGTQTPYSDAQVNSEADRYARTTNFGGGKEPFDSED